MSESQGGAGRREVAFRLFAAEYDDADLSYSESDEERAPNYVVTPTGARVNRLFVVGVLTEVENVSDDYLRARVVDPTGPFVIYAGQYQPEAMNFLERAEPPLFVAVTGKARTFQPEDSDRVYTSIRPESINEVDAGTRDRWVVQAAEQTIDRVRRVAEAKLTGLSGEELTRTLQANGVEDSLADGIPIALDHYGTTGEYLAALRDLSTDAARVVAGERDEVAGFSASPGDGSDDALEGLTERTLDVHDIETEVDEVEAVANAPEPDTEPSPTDEEIDEVVETADLDAGEDDVETQAAEQDTSEGEAEASTTGDEPTDEEPADDAATERDTAVSETGDEPETSEATGTAAESGAGGESLVTDESPAGDEPLEEFDGEFDLDEEERAEIEEEYGTEFQSGSEVEEPGEADIETPTAEPPAEPGEADALDEADTADEGEQPGDGAEAGEDVADDEDEALDQATEDATGADDGETADEDEVETADEVALDDAVMDAMADLDDGDGADRDAVIADVVQSTGADPGEVEDAIQEALMDGRCYEPDDETLKAI